MKNALRNFACMIAMAVALSTLALVVHYQIGLRLLADRVVTIQPGKSVWVECQTTEFSASIEEVTMSGIVVAVSAPSSEGLVCTPTGIVAIGEHRYFLPFQTVLGISVGEQKKWSNPFPI